MEREAQLAGRWYPGDEASCRRAIEQHAAGNDAPAGEWRALIGPHAGFSYSGDAAGKAYRRLAAGRADADLVVVFGAHRGARGPNTIFRGEAWRTPVGALRTAVPLADRLAAELSLGDEPAAPFDADNAVELHLPFVRHFFPRAELLVLGVAAAEVALAIGRRTGEVVREAGRDAVYVGSTDLTHYGPSYDFSPQGGGPAAVSWVRNVNDRGFLDAVLHDEPRGALAHARAHHSACCPGAAVAAMEAARAHAGALHPVLVDHYLSHDVRPSSSFVGYAGIVM
jgi:AmmeMemoRadiSam system protein B